MESSRETIPSATCETVALRRPRFASPFAVGGEKGEFRDLRLFRYWIEPWIVVTIEDGNRRQRISFISKKAGEICAERKEGKKVSPPLYRKLKEKKHADFSEDFVWFSRTGDRRTMKVSSVECQCFFAIKSISVIAPSFKSI